MRKNAVVAVTFTNYSIFFIFFIYNVKRDNIRIQNTVQLIIKLIAVNFLALYEHMVTCLSTLKCLVKIF